jgi:hypothetical protein
MILRAGGGGKALALDPVQVTAEGVPSLAIVIMPVRTSGDGEPAPIAPIGATFAMPRAKEAA